VSDPQEAGAAPSSRVLILEGPSTPLLVEALRGQGESVICAASLSEIEALMAQAPKFDAVVLDLSVETPMAPSSGQGATRKSARGAKPSADGEVPQPGAQGPPGPDEPFVLAFTAGGTSLAEVPPGDGVRVGVCVPAGDTERALREVRGALAQRRLAVVMEELERLRAAVMHARRTAHDLAQPLTTIMARAQLLAGKLKPEDPHARPVGIICEESEKLANLIEQFQRLKAIATGPGSRLD
jgi:hypothetical protein